MLSGNGRHRRPRQAPALIVAAGVTGSAIAIPLLGASGASAAEGTTWDRVAECESGGSWSEDSGNGYYGGLQVTQENWERYGGTTYAASADQASRSQQIAVAERMLADQGLAAWPACGPLSGLDTESGSVDVDTGVADDEPSSPDSSDSSGLLDSVDGNGSSGSKPDSSSSKGADNSAKSDKSAKSSEGAESSDSADPSAGPSAPPAQDPGSDPSRAVGSEPTVAPGRDNSDNSVQTDGDSALTGTGTDGTGRHRGEPADEGGKGDSYIVRAGDNLVSIADSLALDGGWRGLYAANKETVGADPDLILPGQTLEVGVEPGEKRR